VVSCFAADKIIEAQIDSTQTEIKQQDLLKEAVKNTLEMKFAPSKHTTTSKGTLTLCFRLEKEAE